MLQKILSSFNVPLSVSNKTTPFCDCCLCSKSHKLPVGMSTIRANHPFEVVYTDVWGPVLVVSFDKFTYYVVLWIITPSTHGFSC